MLFPEEAICTRNLCCFNIKTIKAKSYPFSFSSKCIAWSWTAIDLVIIFRKLFSQFIIRYEL